MVKQFIKNYSIGDLEDYFRSIGEKEYRAKQIMIWLYEKNAASFHEMTNVSKKLRDLLDGAFSINALECSERMISEIDGTEKYLFKTHDGHYIESVLIKNEGTEDGRLTVCLSSQAGCAMGCRFCETAKPGFIRNLDTAEILDQLSHVRRISGQRNNNIVFMGMGEPFMNYESVMRAADIMNYPFGFHISVRKITISTAGIIEGIERFIDERRPYNLALSLNDTLPEKRERIMPVEGRNPFMEISDMLSRKFPTSRNRLTVVYVMRKDNISMDDAKRLKKMFRYSRIKLNLIPLNQGSHEYRPPTDEEVDRFVQELEIMNVPVTVRKSFGRDIFGACGQLSGRRYATREGSDNGLNTI
ncbi:MAG: 23S rRNA (adenine(2503)-C(2))-methyltransferase [Spirochaetes bacterium RBG_13_51_14]|nr:MAG: 23S rRNA (adenine(2503)-C(2))-methyltransferase [Spirochaetes bacterium RBG_13_51_14]